MKPGRVRCLLHFTSMSVDVRLYHPDRLKSSGGMLSQAQSRGFFLRVRGLGDIES